MFRGFFFVPERMQEANLVYFQQTDIKKSVCDGKNKKEAASVYGDSLLIMNKIPGLFYNFQFFSEPA